MPGKPGRPSNLRREIAVTPDDVLKLALARIKADDMEAEARQKRQDDEYRERTRVALEQAKTERAHASRPLTHAAIADFLDLLSAGYPVRGIVGKLEISVTALYARRHAEPEFARAWDEAIERRYLPIEERLADIAFTGSPDSMATVRAAEVLMKGTNRRYNQAPRMPAVSASIQQGGAEGPRFTMTLGQPTPE